MRQSAHTFQEFSQMSFPSLARLSGCFCIAALSAGAISAAEVETTTSTRVTEVESVTVSRESASEPASNEISAAVLNTVCPVMDAPVREGFSTVYQGKTILFCCGGCPQMFNEDPERYLPMLPQFNEGGAEAGEDSAATTERHTHSESETHSHTH